VNFDRDLHDALQPLAGDPVADAARLLAALPPGPPPAAPRGPWWLPWTMLAVGLAGGLALDRLMPRAEKPLQAMSTEKPDEKEQPKVLDASPTSQGNRMPAGQSPPPMGLTVMCFGTAEIDEPGFGRQELKPGAYECALDTVFRTTKGQIGIYMMANDARVRIDNGGEARVGIDHVALEYGRIFVDAGQREALMQVECGKVKLVFAKAAGVVSRKPSGIEVLGLDGTIDVTSPIDTARVDKYQRVSVDVDGSARPAETVDFLPAETSWMTLMIQMSNDRRELEERVKEVFIAYEKDKARAEAEREMLRLGPSTAWLLTDSIERNIDGNRAYALRAAALLARLLDYSSAAYALPLLLQDDVELRLVIFAAVRARTGTDGGTSEAFWREASRERRRTAVEEWRAELSR
jgi:hypothetical protein